jgi:lipopolysaccharide biosynthesis protein
MTNSAGAGTPRLIAFYLTQYHPIPENDTWWGKGFTEWTNVTKSTPLFDGHYQPHLPTDLGFYDLRLRETRHAQIQMAKQYGIDGFCYHYYWFSGTRLLQRPLDDMLADPQSDMPFCLCWANENWTRRWDAAEDQILIEQKYRPEDDVEFIKSIVPFLSDPRYIRIEGAPLLIVYRPQKLPDARKTANTWRDYCRGIGMDRIHLAAALTHGNEDYQQFGFDSGVEFPPHNPKSPEVADRIEFFQAFRGLVMDYEPVARSYLQRSYPGQNVFRTVFPSWDNTARTNQRAFVILNGTPKNYEFWLAEAMRKTRAENPGQDGLVFINAWNEWAEGCHLEPDRRYGRQFLEATLRARSGQSDLRDFTDTGLPQSASSQGRTLWSDLTSLLDYHGGMRFNEARAWIRRHPKIKNVAKGIQSFVRRYR